MRKLIYFGDPKCKPCKAFKEIVIEQIQKETNAVEIVLVNEQPSRAQRNGVKAIPTTILTEDGNEVKRIVGKFNPEKVIDFLKGGNPFD